MVEYIRQGLYQYKEAVKIAKISKGRLPHVF